MCGGLGLDSQSGCRMCGPFISTYLILILERMVIYIFFHAELYACPMTQPIIVILIFLLFHFFIALYCTFWH